MTKEKVSFIRAATWNAPVNFRTSTGLMSVNGAQSFGANNATFTTRNLFLGGDLTGSGIFSFIPEGNQTIGLGNSAVGTLNLDATELDFIKGTFYTVRFGMLSNTQNIDLRAFQWDHNTEFLTGSGTITVNGAQDAQTNNMTLQTRDVNIAAGGLTGNGGTLNLRPDSSQTIGLGPGATGTFNLATADLDLINDGWGLIAFGLENNTQAMDIRARSWLDPVSFRSGSGVVTVNGGQRYHANAATFRTDADVSLLSTLSGNGTLTFEGVTDGTTYGLAGGAGTLNLTSTELDQIQNGFSMVAVGRTGATGAIQANAYVWNDPFTFQTSGGITLAGAQTAAAGSDVSATLNGNSTLASFGIDLSNTAAGAGAITLGAGTHAITGDLLSNGGNITVNGTVNLGGAAATQRSVNAKTGTLTVSSTGSIVAGTRKLDLIADSMAVAGAITGSDSLQIRNHTAAQEMKLGAGVSGAGLVLDASELAQIGTGFSDITFQAQNGAMTLGASSFSSPLRFLTTGTTALGGEVSTSAGGNSLILTTQQLTNSGGALNAGAGRLLYYATNPDSDSYGGITRPTIRYGRTFAGNPPAGVSETGNVFMYSVTPTLTFTADNLTREYGLANPAFTYTHSGLIGGDTLSAAATGTPNLSSIANLLSGLGTYAITPTIGSLASAMGYHFAFVNGTLTIDPATLTVTADNKNRTIGDATPPLTFSAAGFRAGDTNALLGGIGLASAGLTANTAGQYAITRADNSVVANYIIQFINGVYTVLAGQQTSTPPAPNSLVLIPNTVNVASTNLAAQSSLLLSFASTQDSQFRMDASDAFVGNSIASYAAFGGSFRRLEEEEDE